MEAPLTEVGVFLVEVHRLQASFTSFLRKKRRGSPRHRPKRHLSLRLALKITCCTAWSRLST